MVTHHQGWATSYNLVRALDDGAAKAMFMKHPPDPYSRESVEVEPVEEGNWPGILWTYENCPDSERE